VEHETFEAEDSVSRHKTSDKNILLCVLIKSN